MSDCNHDFDSGYFDNKALMFRCKNCGLYAKDYIEQLQAKNKKLKFMIDNGLGYEDLRRDE